MYSYLDRILFVLHSCIKHSYKNLFFCTSLISHQMFIGISDAFRILDFTFCLLNLLTWKFYLLFLYCLEWLTVLMPLTNFISVLPINILRFLYIVFRSLQYMWWKTVAFICLLCLEIHLYFFVLEPDFFIAYSKHIFKVSLIHSHNILKRAIVYHRQSIRYTWLNYWLERCMESCINSNEFPSCENNVLC